MEEVIVSKKKGWRGIYVFLQIKIDGKDLKEHTT